MFDKKQLPDGTWVEKVNHQEQTPEENMTDMIAGFFGGNLLNKENLRQIILDVIEYADSNQDNLFKNGNDELPFEPEEGDEVFRFELSICFVYQRIADTIVRKMGDLEFARQVYRRSEELADSIEDFTCLATSIDDYLKDEAWRKSLITKAHSLVKNSSDVLKLYYEYAVYVN